MEIALNPELRERMTSFGHALLGVVFVLKGVAKADHWPEHAFVVVLFVGAGILVFVGIALHRRLAAGFPAVVLGVMTWLYVEAGKRWLPWVTAATTLGLLVLAVHRLRHPPARHGA